MKHEDPRNFKRNEDYNQHFSFKDLQIRNPFSQRKEKSKPKRK
jgi:hypothetical protein